MDVSFGNDDPTDEELAAFEEIIGEKAVYDGRKGIIAIRYLRMLEKDHYHGETKARLGEGIAFIHNL